jgi:asparagine synthase (glutamine-hydrolysing)
MCGIAGTLDLAPGLAPAEDLVASMTDMLVHRGPDDAGMLVDGPLTFGHRRLSIIDLSAGGHQPMSTPDGRLWIAFNGEIYNYLELRTELVSLGCTFETQSDTEVLLTGLAVWGADVFPRLNGMFAFALWDRARAQLVLARDRFGVKPLYYCEAAGRLRFASEIKALLVDPDVPRRPNLPRVAEFLAFGIADHTEETMFEGVRQVRPGAFVTARPFTGLDPGTTWYRPRAARPPQRASVPQVLRTVLESAVSVRLRSDVPVGVALSGGLDSTSVMALAAAERRSHGLPPLESFTARSADPRLDESGLAVGMAAAAGSVTHQVLPTAHDLVSELDSLLWHMDEPVHSSSVFGQRKVHELARAHGVPVLLDGSGGDEVLSGYHHFHYAPLLLSYVRGGDLVAFVRELRTRKRIHGIPHRELLAHVAKRLLGRGPRTPSWLLPSVRVPPHPVPAAGLEGHQSFGLFVAPLPAYNHHSDRNSMTFSIETRNPMLDVRLVELVRGLDGRHLLRNGLTKWALRNAVADVLTEPVLRRTEKQGFTTDQGLWLDGELGLEMAGVLRSPELRARELVDVRALVTILSDPQARRRHHAELWRVLVTERWFRLMVDPARLEPPPAPVTAKPSAVRAADNVVRPEGPPPGSGPSVRGESLHGTRPPAA